MRSRSPAFVFLLIAAASLFLPAQRARAQLAPADLALLQPERRTGFAHAGWKYDRYPELPSLDAHTAMVLADLEGPGIINFLHMTRHQPEPRISRGVVLEIRFDDAEQPAVSCPVADFFGDGCNGRSRDFSSRFLECAPWSYNAFFPMLFAKRAHVVLRNDTDQDLADYSYIEWERLPEWDPRLGYFHATYRRECIQRTPETVLPQLAIEGAGHLLGRQYSVVTDEPLFHDFTIVMEGNNEVDIDGEVRRIDYLGSEDSFTFSWGFQAPFVGRSAGMSLVESGDTDRLSVFRFHDHQPIRFQRSLAWRIDWAHERGFTQNSEWARAVARDGCWVDYATVFYWYQSVPDGGAHAPLPPVAERGRDLLRSSQQPRDLQADFAALAVDREPVLTFDSATSLQRVAVLDAWPATHPFWIDEPAATGGHPGNPNPGRRGILAVHPRGRGQPCWVLRRVVVPTAGPSSLRLVVSGDPHELPGKGDFVLRAGVHVDGEVRWFADRVVAAGTPPAAANWQQVDYALDGWSGREVGIVVVAAYGGPNGICNDEAFFDEISVRPAVRPPR